MMLYKMSLCTQLNLSSLVIYAVLIFINIVNVKTSWSVSIQNL